MDIEREILIKLLEAFVDVVEVFQRETMLYQILFIAACKVKGLNDDEIRQLVERGRADSAARIKDASQPSYQDLRAKVPLIVDMLDSDRDAALRLLKEWKPTGLPN